jgi:hypothetical protein
LIAAIVLNTDYTDLWITRIKVEVGFTDFVEYEPVQSLNPCSEVAFIQTPAA